MQTRTWQYLMNQFENSTRTSYKKAVKLSTYHEADLKKKALTESKLVPIHTRYLPLHIALVQEYNNWKSAGGSQEGQTLNLEQMLDVAYSNINDWELSIQVAGLSYRKGTPAFKAIFMNGRNPFSRGSIDDRINAYDTLALNMKPYKEIESIMDRVRGTYADLDAARNSQLGAKGTVKSMSGNVERARINAMTMQWRNLGFAMDTFWDRLEYIESMFDLQTLRDNSQSIFTGKLEPKENEAVLVHTFLADDELKLRNKGAATIHFYLGTMANGTDSMPVMLEPMTELVIMISAFGVADYSLHRFLTVVNQSDTTVTKYEVDVL
ncbi:hypothetical protein [Flavobacterium sp. SM2513]|uniref:hypothetical protein n=1 Tax=Flavobacterium sp. SM2513 TaxID=3424766 RepID=UPI003D7FB9CE